MVEIIPVGYTQIFFFTEKITLSTPNNAAIISKEICGKVYA
jgi:hypothetical protein